MQSNYGYLQVGQSIQRVRSYDMKYTYEEKTELNVIIRTDENGIVSSVPIDPANSDYQAYLNPEAALSTPIATE